MGAGARLPPNKRGQREGASDERSKHGRVGPATLRRRGQPVGQRRKADGREQAAAPIERRVRIIPALGHMREGDREGDGC
jgi:hypothetical protein